MFQRKSVMCFRDQVSSDLDSLDELHKKHRWIPDRERIRPTFQTLARKYDLMDSLELEWESLDDFILASVFKKDYVSMDGKKQVLFKHEIMSMNCNFGECEFMFQRHPILQKSMFPYNLEDGYHYVLWFLGRESVPLFIVQQVLNSMIPEHIQFAWYVNPKPSVDNFFHVQVFVDHELEQF